MANYLRQAFHDQKIDHGSIMTNPYVFFEVFQVPFFGHCSAVGHAEPLHSLLRDDRRRVSVAASRVQRGFGGERRQEMPDFTGGFFSHGGLPKLPKP